MSKPACHNYVIKVEDRDGLNDHLKQRNISTGVHYIPNNLYDMYKEYKGHTPVSDSIWKKLLTLPLYPDLDDDDVKLIIDSVKEFFS